MGKKYTDEASILTGLILMVVAMHGPGMLARFKELGITPDMPDEEIDAALEKLIGREELGGGRSPIERPRPEAGARGFPDRVFYSAAAGCSLVASGPFRPWAASNSTFWPS